jgi:hypothetical protein
MLVSAQTAPSVYRMDRFFCTPETSVYRSDQIKEIEGPAHDDRPISPDIFVYT